MAKCTKAQIERWDSALYNGFRFDVSHYLMFGEKTAKFLVDLSDGCMLQARLEYDEERKGSGYGYTGRQVPVLHLSIWRRENNGMLSSRGLGKTIALGDVQTKRNYSYLCKLSGTLDAAKVVDLANENMDELDNPFVLT